MKLVSLFMDEIQELVDDPAKARYKPIIAEFIISFSPSRIHIHNIDYRYVF
jgi:hypothetical protein